jgi:GT2 family glycosyltransferase
MMERLQELAFDFYERYVLLERIEKLFRPRAGPYRVLDVGGHTPAFWPGFSSMAAALIPQASVAVVDVLPHADLQNYIQATGLDLPFGDESFDLVCSLDTLEHLPADDRPALLAELLRVTRDGLYVAFPFDSASNRWAENVLVEYADVVLHESIPALLEHRQFGLPDREAVARFLAAGPHPWMQFEQGNTDVWLLMMLTYHTLRRPGTDFVGELNRRFNQVYAAQDWAAPAYRAGYVLSKRQAPAALATLRDSFGAPAGKGADLQAVLAFCQLFFNLAQGGRALVDKDRHIRNIEAELAATERGAGELRTQLQDTITERETLRTDLQSAADEREALRSDLRTVWQKLTAKEWENSGLQRQLDELTKQIEDLQEALDAQEQRAAQANAANLESLARVYDRMKDLEIALVTNRRDIQAIYDSRIWKTLRSLAGTLLRWTGRAENSAAAPAPAAARTDTATPAASGEYFEVVCDEPGTQAGRRVRDVIEVRGWALAQSGIQRVLVRINDAPPAAASYGVPRPDVARNHPEVPGADRCGYQFFWDTTSVPEGPATVRVIAVAAGGQTMEVACSVTVDQKATPDYELWIARHEPSVGEKQRMREEVEKLAVRPTISIAAPVYKTPLPLLERAIESVRAQIYPHWQLCLADDGSNDARLAESLRSWAARDARIQVVTLERNRGISGATNAALELCTGEYLAFLDSDDELADFALSEVVRAINEDPSTDVYYSDEDKLDARGRRYDVFFKPGWSPELFLSCNYLCHFIVLKRWVLEQVNGLDESYRHGTQDYEFLLRVTGQTQKIRRIPKVLYHWRALEGSTAKAAEEKPQACAAGQRALDEHVARQHPGATVEEIAACRYRVHYPIAGNPRVSILMPTGGKMNLLRAAVEDVLHKTAYPNYDLLLIDNSRASHVQEYAARLAERGAPVRYLDWRNRPFNFSVLNNEAARRTDAPYILFLNDDMTIITPEWLEAMLEHAQRPEIGAVGAQLLYPNNTIQHGGVVMGIYGNSGHAFKGLRSELIHYFNVPNVNRNCSAVTAACLLIAREKFFEAGGFDETNLAVAFQDVDLCLKLLELGYRNVYTPHAKLYHYESVTKAEKIPNPLEDGYMKRRWAKYIADDPYYNPNLTRRREDFAIALD